MQRVSAMRRSLPMRVHSNSYLKNVVNAKRDRAEGLLKALEPVEPLPLTYQATVKPEFILPSGWAPKPAQPPQHLPFQVPRTPRACALPVYSMYKNGRSRVVTVVRHIDGDVEEFAEEFKKVCKAEIVERRGATVQCKGHHVENVRHWLYGLGF